MIFIVDNLNCQWTSLTEKQLKQKLDRSDKFKLVNALGEWAFNAKHIPGSINISKIEDAKKVLNPIRWLLYTAPIHLALQV